MKKKNQTSATNKYWLLLLSILCVLLMVLSVFAEEIRGPLKGIASVTVIPMQKGINQIGLWIGDFSENFETLDQLKSENEKLQEQVEQLDGCEGHAALLLGNRIHVYNAAGELVQEIAPETEILSLSLGKDYIYYVTPDAICQEPLR